LYVFCYYHILSYSLSSFLSIQVYGCIPGYDCNLCIFIVRVYVFLLLSTYSYCSSMYSYRCLCILIVVYVILDAATLTVISVLFPQLFVLYRSVYCLCVNVYFTTATG